MTIRRSSYLPVPFPEKKLPFSRKLRNGYKEVLYEHTVGIDERAHQDIVVEIEIIGRNALKYRRLDMVSLEPVSEGQEMKTDEINHMFYYPEQEYFSRYNFPWQKVEFSWEPTLPPLARK